jgi:phosphoribosylformylglycinamidine synthase
MARLALGEALTNLCLARASALQDVRASVNWMYAAKMKAEGVAMYDAAIALRWAAAEPGGAGAAGDLEAAAGMHDVLGMVHIAWRKAAGGAEMRIISTRQFCY